MDGQVNRRSFLKYSALAAGAVASGAGSPARAQSSADKVNVAFIGVGGRGEPNREECIKAGCNVVALCDVDRGILNRAASRHPGAKTYTDYRKLFEHPKDFDAVLVATPDHHHFSASMRAIALGKHVYCEKPLTHSVWEARMLAEATKKAGVATQMGNQGHAGEGIRLLTEWVQAGAIGAVREVHVWTDRPIGWWPQGMERPDGEDPIPGNLDWDSWIGPAPMRPFKQGVYHGFKWRGFWDFGTGALGDIGCHSIDLPWQALKLSAPTSVESFSSGGTKDAGPLWSDIIYQFPATGDRPAVKLTWYDGRNKTTPRGSAQYRSIAMLKELAHIPEKNDLPEGGTILVGDKGTIFITGGGPRLVPESKMADFRRPEKTLPRSIGHHAEWLEACKSSGKKPGSNFEYAGPLAEAVLLGNISLRLGKKIEWDPKALKCTNAPEADSLIRREYRKGWEVG